MTNKKILILGLDNSGKTSVVLSLLKRENLLTYAALTPTKGIDRNIFEEEGTTYSIWDFGGQTKYRERHMQKIETYLEDADQIIYLIDIQDKEKYEVALTHLKAILSVLNNEEHSNIRLSVYLHKFDPNFHLEIEVYQDLLDRIESLMPKFSIHSIYKTSIVPVFRKVEELLS